MAKLILSDVSNLLGNPTTAATTINTNNDAIEAALENTLSRDGTTPNQMAADLDMNNNDILNANAIETESLVLNGQLVAANDLLSIPASILIPVTANTMLVDNAAGDARETKTFAEVNEKLGVFETKADASATTIDATINSLRLGGSALLGDGLGGLYIDTDNGATDTFTSNGGTRTWYRALFDLPTIASGDAGKIVAVNATEDGFELETIESKATPFVDVASAATVDLGAASSPSVNITGTTTITSFGTSAPDGAEYLLKFAGAVTVTHGASLILPEATDVVTYAGMTMRVRKELGNVWRVIWYSSRLDIAGGGANRIKFDAAALTANRTLTLPDADVTLSSPALPQNIVVFDASGTYTKPAGLKAAKVTVIGGGGGGGGKNNVVSTAGGGAGGGTAISILLAASMGATETVTIGAGGAGGTTSGADGGNGGTSSFGSIVVATGGMGGPGSTKYTTGNQGGIGTTGQLLIRGGRSGASSGATSWITSCGASILGATGSAGSAGASAAPPNSGGGGGPGAWSPTIAAAGAAGGSGVVIVEEYY